MSKYSIDWVGVCCAQNPHLITAQRMNAVTIKDSQIILLSVQERLTGCS
jgi:hypothetical protein